MCEDPAHAAQTEEKGILGGAGRSRNGARTRREPETLTIGGREENQAGEAQTDAGQVASGGVAADPFAPLWWEGCAHGGAASGYGNYASVA